MRGKILLLGGSYGQIPAINEAKRRGLYTILCDYLPDNPGKGLADEFHQVSTTDKENVLELARKKNIDCILAYASDPAALTAAFVSEKMGLIGSTSESVELLSYKDLFRNFQARHHYKTPQFKVLSGHDDFSEDKLDLLLPVVVKPVDGADTKGVSLVRESSEFHNAISLAGKYARCGRIIIEEKIDDGVARLHGDGFVLNGKLEFCELGDQICTSASAPLKPTCTYFPSKIDNDQLQDVIEVIAKMIEKSGFRNGPVNIEARINSKNEIYIMEIGPRSGGSLTPQCISLFSGFDMLKAQFDLVEGKKICIEKTKFKPSLLFGLYSEFDGIFQEFQIHDDLKPFLAESVVFKKTGEKVKSYDKPGSHIGTLLFTFTTIHELHLQLDRLIQKIKDGLRINLLP